MTTTANSVLAGLRLLVVEDEFLIAEHIEEELKGFGFDVAGPVATIKEALAAVKEGGLHGVLLDANLHGESSAPVAEELLRALVPFVVVTGYGGRELADDTLNGAPRLIKPFSTPELEATLIAAFIH